MRHFADRVSPLLTPGETAAFGPPDPPTAHTEAELAALVALLASPQVGAADIAVGHSRDAVSAAAAHALVEAWQAGAGRMVSAVVDWPEEAASWLRPARRFAAPGPDAWVVAAAGRGWAQLSRRLRRDTGWEPGRTFGFAAAADPRTVALAGAGTLDGMRGADADGTLWRVEGGWVVR
ncbi:hypothetical protein [Yinghuangia soli]|uniref:Uncharacterized protein n=1 Tax=Yinghuangia soli TaxID=2908204 RepID=A0AA41U1M0_9ACTN|nr:hypothetical protein [Yinghuangia soli]MCF2527702.1 hypothetical protein [Yinghuangia soli]